jgi:Zn-dependent membrane protease YugP
MRDWAAFVGLVLLGFVLRNFIRHVYTRIRKRIDDAIPDHLPIGGGEWLREYAPRDVRILIGPRNHDTGSSIPSSNTIVISPDVNEKRDASYWATAAHELGHALFYRSTFLVHLVFLTGRVVATAGPIVGTFLLFANVLYARPDINAIAFHCLEAGLAGLLLVLVDEAIATFIGMRILMGEFRLDRRDRLGAFTSLAAGYMTYVGFFVGELLVVLQREFIVGMIEHHRHFEASAPMGGARLVIVALLGVLLTVWAVYSVIRGLKREEASDVSDVKRAQGAFSLHELGRGLLGIVVVWLVWDQPGPLVPLVSVVGLLGSRLPLQIVASLVDGVLRGLVVVLFGVLLVLFALLFGRLLARLLAGRRSKKPETEAKKDDAPVSFRSKQVAEQLEVESFNKPSLPSRLAPAVSPVLHLAFAFGLVVIIVGARAS